jgi:hypothetical protein
VVFLNHRGCFGRLNRARDSRYENGERRLDVVELLQFLQSIGVEPISLLKKLLKSTQSVNFKRENLERLPNSDTAKPSPSVSYASYCPLVILRMVVGTRHLRPKTLHHWRATIKLVAVNTA